MKYREKTFTTLTEACAPDKIKKMDSKLCIFEPFSAIKTFKVFMAENGSKMHNLEYIFLIYRGACFRKRRKGFLPIFHAILFAQKEIFHDH